MEVLITSQSRSTLTPSLGHDGTCRSCRRGLFQMCDNEAINGVTRVGGCKCSHDIA
jgi:D-arabinose 1-dehydrogenase-like Zn-dependent alcohol dehydrogenase